MMQIALGIDIREWYLGLILGNDIRECTNWNAIKKLEI